ncbi:MAG TPA: hypothetical protein VHO46_15845 [Bacteroidales bacterium]|nr:hypothetical protein [Bacteroidales bacterium]
MILIRFILICLIVYLLLRGFVQSFFLEDPPSAPERRKEKPPKKKISKDVGEYIDYEEVD